MKDYHKRYRIEDWHLCRAFKFLKRALGPKDVRPICHYLMHDGHGTWVATDGSRLHEWRSRDCPGIGEWDMCQHAGIGEGQYKIIKLLKKSVEIELVNPVLSNVLGARHIFKLANPGYRGTTKIEAPVFSHPHNSYEASVKTYNLIGELYKDDSLRSLRTFNIQFLTDALEYGCDEVLLGCDTVGGHLYIKTSETSAVVKPIRT